MNAFQVRNPGVLTLLQDSGRFGQHGIGLTTGGPVDNMAMSWANLLVGNPTGSTALEVSFGGLELEVGADTVISLAGGDCPVTLNSDRELEYWRSHRVREGDVLRFAYASRFCRSYLAVAGGFLVEPSFGSTATVVREGLGGFDGDKLQQGAMLQISRAQKEICLQLVNPPSYTEDIEVRVLCGYQVDHFPEPQRRRFFSSTYTVSDRADRMGYRLEGPAVESDLDGILSEGICQGAIQIPADGQPIVLLQDRQTIGGYPKIGSALSLDTAELAQQMPGARVQFREISHFEAHNALHLAAAKLRNTKLEPAID